MSNLPEAKIARLAIYPVKSCHRMDLSEGRLTMEGIEMLDGNVRDHDFMVVDAIPNPNGEHEFVQQRLRGMNMMTQIIPAYENNNLVLRWQEQDQIVLDLDHTKDVVKPVKIWDDVVYAVDQGDSAAKWFTQHLERDVRLVRAVGAQFNRPARQNYMANNNTQRFQDGYPILWGDIADVKELEEIAGMELGWERFRPQILTEGFQAQYIHSLLEVMVSGIPMLEPKPCVRCPIPQIDQESGEKSKEPKASLEKYKVWADKRNKLDPIFFENGLPQSEGEIRVGDSVRVVSQRSEKLVYSSRKAMQQMLSS